LTVMSEKPSQFKENVPGKYYVDQECIGCMLCSEIAPDNFRSSVDIDCDSEYSFVYKQPSTEQEDDLCAESMDVCPVDAIGDDGNRVQ
jgi:ferredoxin